MRRSKYLYLPFLTLGMCLSTPAFADPDKPQSFDNEITVIDLDGLTFGALDLQKLEIEDSKRQKERLPYRYAVSHDIQGNAAIDYLGQWSTDNGTSVLKIPVSAMNAHSLSFGFEDVFLPTGAKLFVYDKSGKQLLGPYTDKDHNAARELWTPIIEGDEAYIEINVPENFRKYVRFNLKAVNQGYRGFTKRDQLKSGSCNIDVVCQQGDDWRNEIRSVASYSFTTTGGTFVCTGTLVNNTAQDQKPYFLTANHCVSTETVVNSMVFYWNYETTTCGGTPDGVRSRNSQSGATMKATWDPADMTLVELNAVPSETFNVHWAGWDNSAAAPSSAVAIHHPAGDEKRISFDNDPLMITEYLQNVANANGTHLRVGAWEEGTTEGGSSGSAIWNSDKRIVGLLTGGFAACDATTEPDWYGRVALQWEGGGAPASQLKAWLDPGNSGAVTLDGGDSCTAPGVSFTASPAANQEVGQAITFTSNITGGGQYTYAWDFDGDGTVDSTDASPVYTYSSVYVGNVSLDVTESGCTGSSSQSIVVTHAGGNTPPVAATAQSTITVDEGASVTLDASPSSDANGDALTYAWTQTGGTPVTLSSTSVASPTFTAPSISATETLTFSVTVSDMFGDSDQATVSVTVNNVNQAPVASASTSASSVREGTTVNLSAAASSDPDGDQLTYSWRQTAGPNVSMSGANTSAVSFVAPQVNATTTLTFEVTVSDPAGLSSTDTVSVAVTDTPVVTPPSGGSSGSGGGSTDIGLLALLFMLVFGRMRSSENSNRRQA